MGMLPVLLAFALTQGEAQTWQEGLTPTDVLTAGRLTVQARLGAQIGEASLEAGGTFEEDGDIQAFNGFLHAAVGVGFNLEVEALLPFTFMEEIEVDSGGVGFTQTNRGVGDLTLGLNWAALRDGPNAVQLIGGVFIVLPTGSDDRGEPEFSSPLGTTDGEDGGVGDGAFQYGLQVGLSKRLGLLEPYALFRYQIGGKGEDDNIETDNPDIATLLLGTEIHLGDALTIDGRLFFERIGEEVDEDDTGSESTTEAYTRYGVQGRVYLSLGPQVTLIAGLGAYKDSDHALVEEINLELTGVWLVTAEIGLQISLGR